MRAYVTLLSTDSYLDGVLALNESLKRVGAKYPLVVMVSPEVAPMAREILFALKIETIEISPFNYPEVMIKKNIRWGMPHWNFVADKFRVFGLDQYEKIVFIDADMYVLRNIDELFDKPHLSACQDSPMLNWEEFGSHVELNAGIVVFKPSKQFEEDLITLSIQNNFNDQEALRAYMPDWNKHPELILPQEYNIFAKFWESYEKKGFKPENIRVLHFIGSEKPFNQIKFPSFNNRIAFLWHCIYLDAVTSVHHQLENLDFFKDS